MDRCGIGEDDLIEFAEEVGYFAAVEVDLNLADVGIDLFAKNSWHNGEAWLGEHLNAQGFRRC